MSLWRAQEADRNVRHRPGGQADNMTAAFVQANQSPTVLMGKASIALLLMKRVWSVRREAHSLQNH